ncbi:MAG: TIGR04282 family arsenosugar biosynthesis glycosyltransferase [Armatimonadetes bacterium]|nr:TIGR04282 family arsenosugar biosynthesis glycosyltransferase [Armatimonadota bacterium]
MISPSGDRAVIVVMAKAPRPGRVKTRLIPVLGTEGAAALHRCFLADTLALARAVGGTDVALVAPSADAALLAPVLPDAVPVVAQTGDGLAAGLEFAMAHFAAAGYQRILLFNSDSPHLPAPHLAEALTTLADADLVAGPTEDGGYYLVGARQPWPGLFEGGRMGTGGALTALLEQAAARGLRTRVLASWFDVDTPPDLERLVSHLRERRGGSSRTRAFLGLDG